MRFSTYSRLRAPPDHRLDPRRGVEQVPSMSAGGTGADDADLGPHTWGP
jgi:hypothetical protein